MESGFGHNGSLLNRSSKAAGWQRHVDLLCLLLLTAAAAGLRLYHLSAVPGLQHDEALGGLFAVDVLRGHWPIFFEVDWEEPLFFYVEALSIALFGQTALALRLVGALFGILSVPVSYLLFRRLLPRWTAAASTALLTINYWHLHESRLSYRAISQPFFEALTFYCFWRGWTRSGRRRWIWLVLAGLAMGACMYTYLSSRVFPAVPLAFGLWLLATRRDRWRTLRALGVTMGVWLLAFAPLAAFFLAHPIDFSGRSVQVWIFSTPDPWAAFWQSLWGTLGMFSLHGEYLAKYNFPGKPVFDWPLSAFFYLGLAIAVRRVAGALRRLPLPDAPGPADAAALLLLWVAIMLVPGIFSTESPQFLRTIGVIPAIFGLAGMGLEAAFSVGVRLLPRANPALAGLAALLLAYEATDSCSIYFGRWLHSGAAFYGLHGDAAAVAAYLDAHPRTNAYVSTEYPHHPTIRFLASGQGERVHWFNGREAAVLPADPDALLFYFRDYRPGFIPQEQLFPPPDRRWAMLDPEGGEAVTVFAARDASLPATARELRADVGNAVEATGYTLPDEARAGESAQLLLAWQVRHSQRHQLRFFVHLVDSLGERWAQRDNQPFFADSWSPGDRALSAHALDLPAWTPPAPMTLRAGLYAPAEGRALLVATPGASGGDFFDAGALRVLPAAGHDGARPSPRHVIDRLLGDALQLLGYDLTPERLPAGGRATLVLYWRVMAPPGPGAQVEVSLVREGRLTPLEVVSPLVEAYPASTWPPGLTLADPHQLVLPARTQPGPAELRVSVGEAGLSLGAVEVTAPARQFSLPPVSHEVNARLGEAVELKGYDLAGAGPGQLRLTLVWQALADGEASYKVFAHVLDTADRIVGQRDDFPEGGRSPTSSWLRGQVVRDSYLIPLQPDLPSGTYQLEVGMYDPGTGRRLPVFRDGRPAEDRVLLEPVRLEAQS